MDIDLKLILDSISSPVLVGRPIRNAIDDITDFEIVFYNEEFKKAAGHIINNKILWLQVEEKLDSDIPYFQIAADVVKGQLYPEVTYHSPSSQAWYKIDFNYVEEKDILVVTFTNVTSERQYYTKLKESLLKDPLTGLLNRAAFSDNLDLILEDSKFKKLSAAVVILDIDNLKTINDSLGEKEGDSLIIRVAEILKQFSNQHFKIFRYGDDEFAIIIHDLDSADTVINYVDAIYEIFQMKSIEISGGVSLFPDHSAQKDELIRFADMAIHYAKKNGKNNFLYFEPEMQRVFIQHLTLQTKLTSAILECNFTQCYQPQFDIHTGELRGFEALIRWTDEDLGEIAPSVFIPLAEESGLIVPIGRWVLTTALSTLKTWQDSYGFKGVMSVNVSPVQLCQEDFLSELQSLISKYEINPSSLEIEITEGVFINNMEDTINILTTLKDIGVRVSLDDFGTGYSSLSYLQMMPLNTLKIDKSFINNITSEDGVQANITQAIINMVEKMGLETIAEGVEQPEQLELLDKFNCTVVQGFLRGKPMPKDLCNQYLGGNDSALLKN